MKLALIAVSLLALCGAILPARAEERFDCTNPLNVGIAQTLKPLIEKAKLCKGLKKKVDAGLFKVKVKVDQTKSVHVENINYCTSEASRKIAGTVAVECGTEKGDEVQINLAESFDVAIVINNKTCAVSDFKIEPQGDIGRLIAKNVDFEDMVKTAVKKEIAKACDSAPQN